MPFNPFKQPEKPNWKKTGKERGATDWTKKHKGKKIPTTQEQMKAENRENLKEKVQPYIHPVETAKAAARAKAAQMLGWTKQTARNQTSYKAWGTCPKCLEPNKPRHRCQRIGISFMDPAESRAEYERLKRAYGIGPGKGKGRVKDE